MFQRVPALPEAYQSIPSARDAWTIRPISEFGVETTVIGHRKDSVMRNIRNKRASERRGFTVADGAARIVRSVRPTFEGLESRQLLTVSVPGVSAAEGLPFNGTIATFAPSDVQGTAYRATISWGDGQVTAGMVVPVGTGLSVIGSKTYAVPGTFPVVVTVAGDAVSTATGQGSATVNAVVPVGTPTVITPVAGRTFTGPVASFTDSYPGLTASAYAATIDWGDGTISLGTIQANGHGYEVIGTKVYTAPPKSSTVPVTVIRAFDGQTILINSTSIVANETNALTGHLDPATQTGAVDGVTAINRPTFIGTASPYSIVTVYSRRLDQAQPVALGQAIASAVGAWHFTVIGALPDGVYDVAVAETPTANQPGPLTALTPGGRLVIDTTPPVAVSASFDPRTGFVSVIFRDQLSGVDSMSLLRTTNYALSIHSRFRAHPLTVMLVPTAPVRSSDTVMVALRFDGLVQSLARRKGAAIALGSITDAAGNHVPASYLKIHAGAPSRHAGHQVHR